MTHTNEIAIEAAFLYCYAIGLLINGATPAETYKVTKEEVKNEKILQWFEREIEAVDKKALTRAQPNNIGHLKIAFVWAFYYLKNEWSYKGALKDMLMQGGDTDTNAAIVGGLLGAAYGEEAID